jgi:hypothetical protein
LIINSLWSISQNGYPKEVVIKKDTVVAFTYSQVKEINSELEASKGKDEIIDSLTRIVLDYNKLVTDGNKLVINVRVPHPLEQGLRHCPS